MVNQPEPQIIKGTRSVVIHDSVASNSSTLIVAGSHGAIQSGDTLCVLQHSEIKVNKRSSRKLHITMKHNHKL